MDQKLHNIVGLDGALSVYRNRIEVRRGSLEKIPMGKVSHAEFSDGAIKVFWGDASTVFEVPPSKSDLSIRIVGTINNLVESVEPSPIATKKKRNWLPIAAAVFALFVVVGALTSGDDAEPASTKLQSQAPASNTAVGQETAEPLGQTNNATMGEQNALASALSYLEIMSFSRQGLIEQLEYEGYTNSEATYAVRNCGADWNEQAAKSAETYLSLMAFSRDGLIEQLEYEGFTHEQAVYGVEANGY